MRRLVAIIVAAIALAGCSMDNITVSYQTDQNDIYYASFEEFGDKTRTYVDEDVKLLWHEDDRISLFRTTFNEQFKFTGATGDNSGGFSAIPSDEWVTGNQVSTNYAVYPYDATTRLSNDEIIQLTMPAVQYYAENSFGRGANTMVAASENTSSKFLPFRNLGGYIIVKLYGEDTTIKSIEFKGNNDEIIAGAASAEAKYGYLPVVSMSESGTTTITLDCGEEGVTISSDSANPTSFWFVVPPITFEGGFTFTITDINGNTFTKSTTKTQTVVRNEVKSMSAFEPTFEGEVEDPEVAPKPANNEIWYTATRKVEPYRTNVFGANIVSNEWYETTGEGVITFDSEVTKIGDDAFYNCSSLTSITIPDSVTSIGTDAFSYCSSLTRTTIPDSVTSIGSYAFLYCTGELIVNCNIPSASGYKYGAFYYSGFTSVTIGDSVTSIGDYAFYKCSDLASITIPDSVTSIGSYTFSNCSSLTSVTIPDSVTSIGNSAFSNCKSLTSVTIPDSVTSIGSSAFSRCSSLTSVTIGDSVTSIGSSAFSECSSLTTITIPDSVTSIGSSAFSDCSGLIEFKGKFASKDGRCIIIEGELKSFAQSGLTEYAIPDSVTSIGNSTFSNCSSLTSVTIPDSVTSIGSYAFSSCSSLTSVTIPDDVTFIGSYAFSRCWALTSVYCKPKTPPTSNDYMFNENAVDRKIYVPINSVDAYMSNENWGYYGSAIQGYNFVKPANTEIYYTNGRTTEATTPYATDVFGATIVSNTYDADKECWVIKFDGAVTEIGGSAFYGCSSLTSVTIPDSVTEIGNGAFGDCSSLASITMGNSVKEIQNAFIGCTSLTSVIIPNSVTTIGSYAFQGCSSLAKFSGKFATEDGRCLIVNGKLKSFAPAGLTTYTIPSSVTTIGYGAFHGCTNLTSVVIREGVTTIEDWAFYYCTSLTSVYCYATTPPSLGAHVFDYALSGNYEIIRCNIYVPTKSVEAYKAAWKNHASYIFGK